MQLRRSRPSHHSCSVPEERGASPFTGRFNPQRYDARGRPGGGRKSQSTTHVEQGLACMHLACLSVCAVRPPYLMIND